MPPRLIRPRPGQPPEVGTLQPSGRGYDHGITTFSPDGRLFQVEYARESVKRGTTTAGLKFRDGVVLVCDKRIASRLIIPESIEKMFKIDNMLALQQVDW